MSYERLEKIAPALSEHIKEGRFPGFITAVARKGRVVHFETQGFSDIEKQIPLQKDSLFGWFSNQELAKVYRESLLYSFNKDGMVATT